MPPRVAWVPPHRQSDPAQGKHFDQAQRKVAGYFATEQARRNAQIILISSVAQAYLALVADRENFGIAQTTLATQQASYDLVKRRYDSRSGETGTGASGATQTWSDFRDADFMKRVRTAFSRRLIAGF